jgi:hypothetical protein
MDAPPRRGALDDEPVTYALLGAWLFAAAQAEGTPQSVGGLYEVRQMEMGGGLELQSDGRFRYALEYGAVSERGEGNWEVEGNTVRLTSNPKPRVPAFELVKDEPTETGELYVTLEPPGFGSWTGRIDLMVTIAGMQDPVPMEAGENGRVPLDGMVATAIQPVVPVYGTVGEPIPLARGGHRLLIRFLPNDLGKALFDHEPLAIENGNLLMRRYDAVVTFRPARPSNP